MGRFGKKKFRQRVKNTLCRLIAMLGLAAAKYFYKELQTILLSVSHKWASSNDFDVLLKNQFNPKFG